MKKMLIAAGLLGSLAVPPPAARAGEAAVRQSFDITVPERPAAVPAEGMAELVYELHLTNYADAALTLRAVRIFDAGGGKPLLALEGVGLAERFALAARPGTAAAAPVEPGTHAIVYLEIDLKPGDVPAALVHELEYAAPGGSQTYRVRGGQVMVDHAPTIPLGAPLAGGPWAAIHHPAWPRGHRRVFYSVNGQARLPGRYAIDFVRLDAAGAITRGDPDRPTDAAGYGAPVLAVADALVTAVRDDVAESASIKNNPRHQMGDATGNYVAIKLDDGRFVFYEHLKPGSVQVRVGDRVRRGQAIGALGFTGDTTGPHLHFHVSDANSPLGAEGKPFVFDRFTLLGRYPDMGAFGKRRWQAVNPELAERRSGEWPAPNTVLRFDD
jgi:murein DD-endopeptidase